MYEETSLVERVKAMNSDSSFRLRLDEKYVLTVLGSRFIDMCMK